MRKLLPITIFVVMAFPALSQSNPKFGKVSADDLTIEAYDKDPGASALYIYDVRRLSCPDNTLEFRLEVYVRAKLFTKESFDLATVSVPFTSYDSFKEDVSGIAANSYNLVGGKVVKTSMPKDNIFKEKISDKVTLVKFTLPEVREGCVIEYKYTFSTPSVMDIPDFYVQRGEPVLHSNISIFLPDFIGTSVRTKGETFNLKRSVSNTTYKLGPLEYRVNEISCENDSVPALRKEPMVWCEDDYRSGFSLEVGSIIVPELGIHQTYSYSWDDVNAALRRSSLGDAQKAKNPFKNEVKAIASKDTTDVEKMGKILKMVQGKIKFNGRISLYPDSPSTVVKKATGNMADINNILSLALRDAGFSTHIILLNPRSVGALPYFPSLKQISSFIVRASGGDGVWHYMDGSDPDSMVDILNPELLTSRARIYGVDGEEGWISLSGIKKNQTLVNIFAILSENGAVSGNISRKYSNQCAYSWNRQYQKASSEDSYIENVEKEDNITVEGLTAEGKGGGDVLESIQFKTSVERNGNLLYLPPSPLPIADENPFTSQTRKLPVEFPFAYNTVLNYALTIPEGYVIEELPPSGSYTACGRDAQFHIIAQEQGNSLSIRIMLDIKRTIFSVDEYPELNLLFGKIAEIANSRIVLKKAE